MTRVRMTLKRVQSDLNCDAARFRPCSFSSKDAMLPARPPSIKFRATAARAPQADVPVHRIGDGRRLWHRGRRHSLGRSRCAVERLRAAYARGRLRARPPRRLLLENRPAFLFHWFALNALGVSVVPINAEMRSAELEYLLGHSEIGLAVTLPERAADRARGRASASGVTFETMGRRRRTVPRARTPRRGRRADRRRHRMRPALHLGHHRPPQGLHPEQRLLPARRRWYAAPRRRVLGPPRHRNASSRRCRSTT
jgi:acyl-CoA synthetase (AMP-forming)/AMP-acid ligase II